jgi:glutamate dehydrogenase/leucine dehydrogenase
VTLTTPTTESGAHAPERVRVERGPRSGQTIVVSVDSTRLGPALGGCRLKTYPSWQDGLADAVRLSAAMTDKAALAGLDHGGGKTVVALTGSSPSEWTGAARDDLFADVADVVEGFGGSYVTGPDVGTGPADMLRIHRRTRHVLCRPEADGGSGDSSGPTATGVVAALDAVAGHLWPGRDPGSLSFSVLGLGHVGTLVAAELAARGAELVVSDVDPARRSAAEGWGATWLPPEEALRADVDVLVPCAVGGLLTARSVADLNCRAVAGPANNQLDADSTAEVLHRRGIRWAPDPLVSAGGIVAAAGRELQGLGAEETRRRVTAIGDRVREVLAEADASGTTPLAAARARARRRLG